MKKTAILLILLNILNLLFPLKNPPAVIKTEDKIIDDLSKTIYRKFPAGIEILMYDLILINGSLETERKINQKFRAIMKDRQDKNQYSIIFVDEIDFKELNINKSFLDNYDESELIAFGKYIKKDAVILGTITMIDNAEKTVWDPALKKKVVKKTVLLQVNVFGTDAKAPLMRFSGYFLL